MPSSPLRRAALTAAALAGPVGFVARAAWGLPVALGAGRRTLRPTVAGSPQFADGRFHPGPGARLNGFLRATRGHLMAVPAGGMGRK